MRVHWRLILQVILPMNLLNIYEASVVNEVKSSVNELLRPAVPTNLTLNTTQMIVNGGYMAEKYEVITEDGYILTFFRIKNTGPVVFLMHGFLVNSDDFLTSGKKCLPFLLAEAGYDVYLGNSRGTRYGRKHIKLSPNESAFWDFSFHEVGYYDVPAMIDFALENSKATQLSFIGHSQGTTDFYVMASLKPEYNNKVNIMINLAAIAWLYHEKTPVLRILVPLRYEGKYISETLGLYDIFSNVLIRLFLTRFCPISKFTLDICSTLTFMFTGFDYGQLNYTQNPVELGHIISGGSIKEAIHLGQLIANRDFRQYEYKSTIENIKKYGSKIAPSYPVEKITSPMAIIYAENDFLSTFEDVKILISKLPNVVVVYKVPYARFNHRSYLFAKNAKVLVYDKVLQLLGMYNNKI